jgi:hypothetical protein
MLAQLGWYRVSHNLQAMNLRGLALVDSGLPTRLRVAVNGHAKITAPIRYLTANSRSAAVFFASFPLRPQPELFSAQSSTAFTTEGGIRDETMAPRGAEHARYLADEFDKAIVKLCGRTAHPTALDFFQSPRSSS